MDNLELRIRKLNINMKKIKFIYNDVWDFNIWYFKDWERSEIKSYLIKKYQFFNFSQEDAAGSVILLPVYVKDEAENIKEGEVYCLYLSDTNDTGIVAHESF